MRIGNWLGGSVIWALAATMSMAASAGTAEHVTTVPLGGSLDGLSGDHHYGVYVPTRFGGELKVTTTEGQIVDLKGPNGHAQGQRPGHRLRPAGLVHLQGRGGQEALRRGDQLCSGGSEHEKALEFLLLAHQGRLGSRTLGWGQRPGRHDELERRRSMDRHAGRLHSRPAWTSSWPGRNGLLETLPAAGDDATWFPNLYDDLEWIGPDKEHGGQVTRFKTPSPLLKYDQLFNTSARQWEAAFSQNKDISRWPGHCLGGAVASILLNEPSPAPGSGLTRDELKALWAELGENHYNHRIGDFANEIPPGPPQRRLSTPPTGRRPGCTPCSKRTSAARKRPCSANLRAFPPRGTISEVWNHGVYKYIATYKAIPGRGERAVNLKVEVHANSGSTLNGQDDKDRVINYEYNLVYGLDGKVDETNPMAADWISVRGDALYAPLNVLQLVESRWGGHNLR